MRHRRGEATEGSKPSDTEPREAAQTVEDPRSEPLSHAQEHGGGERVEKQSPAPQRWCESGDTDELDDWDLELTQEELRECEARLGLPGGLQPGDLEALR